MSVCGAADHDAVDAVTVEIILCLLRRIDVTVADYRDMHARIFLDLSDEKKTLEIGLWLYTLNNSKDALRAQESKIATAQMQYKEIEEALNEFDTKSEQNTAQFTFITSQIENIRQRIALSNEETVKFEGEISVLNSGEISLNFD